MFDNYSQRALQVLFASRAKAGQRGAEALEICDLLAGIVLEDQHKAEAALLGEVDFDSVSGDTYYVGIREYHPCFFSAEQSSDLQLALDSTAPHSNPRALSEDLPISDELKLVFENAENIRKEFQHQKLEPLHQLAAILQSGKFVELFRNNGITKDKIQGTLRGELQPRPYLILKQPRPAKWKCSECGQEYSLEQFTTEKNTRARMQEVERAFAMHVAEMHSQTR